MFFPLPAAAAAQAASADDQTSFDIRCMIVSQQVQEQAEGAEKAALTVAAMYYFGRVDAKLAGSELEKQIEAESKKVEGQPIAPILKSCGDFMTARGAAMMRVGQALERKERALATN